MTIAFHTWIQRGSKSDNVFFLMRGEDPNSTKSGPPSFSADVGSTLNAGLVAL